jgi:hypothetical protein
LEIPFREGKLRSSKDYNQLETFRQLGKLVEKYGFKRKHPSIKKAAEYFLNLSQT